MKHDVRLPDLEVVVLVGGSEQYKLAAWLDPDIHAGFHCVSAIDSPTSAKAVRSLLLAAVAQIDKAVWKPLDVLDSLAGEDGQDTPF